MTPKAVGCTLRPNQEAIGNNQNYGYFLPAILLGGYAHTNIQNQRHDQNMKTNFIRIALALAGIALPQFSNGVTINFDNFPDSTPVPNGTVITTQYLPVGVTFSSDTLASAPSAGVFAGEASSPPNMLVGSFDTFVGLHSIVMDFTPAASPNSVAVNLISVGTGIVTAKAFASDLVTVLDTVSVTHGLGAGNGFGNVDPINLSGLGIARVQLNITQTTSIIDGYGIDDVVFTPASVPEPSIFGLAAVGMSSFLASRRAKKAA